MKVAIKDLGIDMLIKTRGLELDIKNQQGNHIGDLVINNRGVEWCRGKSQRGKGGIKYSWKKFFRIMEGDN